MAKALIIEEFLAQMQMFQHFDMRTPAEFADGHIPGAINLPLFTNEERAIIGTIYKREGQQKAILKGLDFIGPRMSSLIKSVEKSTNKKTVLLHCWRGGMRSGSVAWLLGLYGFEVFLLKGGYKAYRNWVLDQFNNQKKLLVLGGSTGSGKTQILHELHKLGEQVVDLEEMACHKGSAFGAIGEKEPPTQEQFENDLAKKWSVIDEDKICWIEDEGRTIGKKVLPEPLWQQIRDSQLICLDIPVEERVKFLVSIYGAYPKNDLQESIERIKKRLGGLAAQQAIEALNNDNLAETARILLKYYDKTYSFGLQKREQEKVENITFTEKSFAEIALALQQKFSHI